MQATAAQIAEPHSTGAVKHRVQRLFDDLGQFIEARVGVDREQVYRNLEQVAAEALRIFQPSAQCCAEDLTDYVLTARELCEQADLDGKFAEPPVSLFRSAHFDISALTWLDGTTSIHEHGFCGAFHVLSGGSIHCQYQFSTDQPTAIAQRAINGRLELKSVEVLRQGDTRVIRRGRELIHSLFHLVRPSITIVIRTITDDPETEIQYDFRWPGLAFHPFQRHAPTIRKTQYLRMLRNLDRAQHACWLLRLLHDADLFLAYTLISEEILITAETAGLAELLEACKHLSQSELHTVEAAVQHDLTSRTIIGLRGRLHHPEHRFFLALLLNVFDRNALLRMVGQEFPDADPITTIMRWMHELTGQTERYGNLLELNFNPTALRVLELLWRGFSADQVLSDLSAQHGAATVHAEAEKLRALIQALRESALFAQVLRATAS